MSQGGTLWTHIIHSINKWIKLQENMNVPLEARQDDPEELGSYTV